jgi:hypothetical protein
VSGGDERHERIVDGLAARIEDRDPALLRIDRVRDESVEGGVVGMGDRADQRWNVPLSTPTFTR